MKSKTLLSPSKVIMGTAQFGMAYGVSNNIGKLSFQECEDVISLAKERNIVGLDTALTYGDSQRMLSRLNIQPMAVQSKLSVGGETPLSLQVDQILLQLDVTSVDTVLIHDPWVLSNLTVARKQQLMDLRNDPRLGRLGLSVYSADEIVTARSFVDFEVLQLPINIFDQRFCNSTLIDELACSGVEIQGRSIFLQGLLLSQHKLLNPYFKSWDKLFSRFDSFCERYSISKLAACLSFFEQQELIEKLVIGVESADQFLEILNCPLKTNLCFEEFKSTDLDLILPGRWRV